MSLRTRLLASLALMLAVALVAAGVLLVGLTRASLVDRVDRELRAVDSSVGQLQRLANLAASDNEAGRRLAVMRLDRQGNIVRSFPSGFAHRPGSPPRDARLPGGRSVHGLRADRGAAGCRRLMDYRVLTRQARGNVIVAVAAPMAAVDAAVAALIRTLVLTGALAMAGLLIVAWLVVRHDLLPLERIARTAEQIAGGDLSHRAGVPHDDTEVGRLGSAFDAMLDQIETSFGQQQAALDAKARSEDRLRRFVADASHELRTPLTAVRGLRGPLSRGRPLRPRRARHGDGPDRDREPADGRARRRPAAARAPRRGAGDTSRPGRPVADRRGCRGRRACPRAGAAGHRKCRAGRRRRGRR